MTRNARKNWASGDLGLARASSERQRSSKLIGNRAPCDFRFQEPYYRASQHPQQVGADGSPGRRSILPRTQAYSQAAHSEPGEPRVDARELSLRCKDGEESRLRQGDAIMASCYRRGVRTKANPGEM